MAINKWKLFEEARERWPQRFQIIPTDGSPCFEADPELVAVYRSIEDTCTPSGAWSPSDEWAKLANWSFNQALWQIAEQVSEERFVLREEVSFDAFDHWMRFNLSDEMWMAERQEYDASPSRFQ